jgi:hypothetical protein
MRLMRRLGGLLVCLVLAPVAAWSQDANITQPVPDIERQLLAEPMIVTHAQISRPAIAADITLRADVTLAGAPLRVKLRRALPGAEGFNNEPRYELAAYQLQKLCLDPADYVVPPTALRMMPVQALKQWAPEAVRTFPGAEEVLVVLQYWLQDVKTVADVYYADRFAADPLYARHIGQLNILTFLIVHRDSNPGNFLIGRQEGGTRVFSVDHGVAFGSPGSDRGELWRPLRVEQLPADAVERLRGVTPEVLEKQLGVLAQWQLRDGRYVSVPAGENLAPSRGVRRKGDVVQMGLTRSELAGVNRQLKQLLDRVDRGAITLVPANGS